MSKWFHCIFFIMINISIHTNTFFKICGFARFDPFHHFLKCMLGISRWFHFVFFFIMMKTSIFTNTFFKIRGFARFDRFDDFLKCMLNICRKLAIRFVTLVILSCGAQIHVGWHCSMLRAHTVHSNICASGRSGTILLDRTDL